MEQRQSALPDAATLNEAGKKALGTTGDSWTPEAMELVKKYAVEVGDDLYKEAISLAKRQRVQTVSDVHVEDARKRLLAKPSQRWVSKFAGIVGGALLGCALGLYFSFLGGQKMNTLLVGAVCLMTAVGTALSLYSAIKR